MNASLSCRRLWVGINNVRTTFNTQIPDGELCTQPRRVNFLTEHPSAETKLPFERPSAGGRAPSAHFWGASKLPGVLLQLGCEPPRRDTDVFTISQAKNFSLAVGN